MPDQPPRPPLSRARIAETEAVSKLLRQRGLIRLGTAASHELCVPMTVGTWPRRREVMAIRARSEGALDIQAADLLDAFLAGSRADTEE